MGDYQPSLYHLTGGRLDTEGTLSWKNDVKSLLQSAADGHDETFGYGSMSCAIYDTAWVSMVAKETDRNDRHWLFPKCFHYLLDQQADNGSWGATDNQTDGILNTASAILSLLRHQDEPLNLDYASTKNLGVRIEMGIKSLRSQLQAWDVTAAVHVGFEIIVPTLLELLAQESVQFSFHGYHDLMKMNQEKLSKFYPDLLYGSGKFTAIHSLEAFVGKIDFDRISHHVTRGSMMGSPSSTAAYLMSATTWDQEAEAYLHHVVDHASGKGNGGVPSAYPSTVFEYSWALSTLFASGLSPADLESPGLTKIKEILRLTFEQQDSIVGFAPSFMADVDDTAKTILCLKALNINASPRTMIETFEGKIHFRTYLTENNSSFSANCNALLALLEQDVPQDYSEQIIKICGFLCDTWWNSISRIQDKWSLSYLYPTLLFVEAAMKLVELNEKGIVSSFGDRVSKSKVAVCLYQACYRTFLDQNDDGSWNNSIEETSYGILILVKARRLLLFQHLHERLDSAIDRAANLISSVTKSDEPQRLWVEKVSYTSPFLTEIYRLAAVWASAVRSYPYVGQSLCEDISVIPKLVNLWTRTPLFSNTPEWQIRASMVEGTLFLPIIKTVRLDVFKRTGVAEDKYFDVIPLAWPIANNWNRAFAPPAFLLEGMMAAMLNYQVDEFMEAVAGVNYAQSIPELRRLIDDVVVSISKESEACASNATNGSANVPEKSRSVNEVLSDDAGIDIPGIDDSKREEVLQPLRKFVTRALKHPSVLSASAWDRKNMTCELRIYLQSHVTQSEDNMLLKEGRFTDGIMREHFFRWVRTTSADHTSAPYTFNFVSCLLSSWVEDGKDCFPSTQEKYYATAVCQHLATMCRMYNDHGSALRDRDEANVNSIDFPEFGTGARATSNDNICQRQRILFEVAQYERACIEEALRLLESHGANLASVSARARKKRQMELWRLFYNVTDFWGQMYVLRDMGSPLTISRSA